MRRWFTKSPLSFTTVSWSENRTTPFTSSAYFTAGRAAAARSQSGVAPNPKTGARSAGIRNKMPLITFRISHTPSRTGAPVSVGPLQDRHILLVDVDRRKQGLELAGFVQGNLG